MSDIARRVGVSQATVSLVLNKIPGTRISQETRRRVLEAAQEIGYRKGPAIQPGARVIGLLINELTTSQHLNSLLEGARDEATANDCLIAVISTLGDPDVEAAALRYLTAQPLVGVLYATLLTRGVTLPEPLREIPTVLLNCHAAGDRVPSVVPGDIAGGFAATAALLEAGHRRVAMICSEDWIEASRDRLKGYRQALATYDIAPDPNLVVKGGWTLAGGRTQALRLLDLPDPPTAIFCFCDRVALGAYEAAAARGLRIPDELSIIGFDDENFAADMAPPLTTLVLPHEEMARWAVGRLLDSDGAADASPIFRRIKMECQLVHRGSVSAPPLRRVRLG